MPPVAAKGSTMKISTTAHGKLPAHLDRFGLFGGQSILMPRLRFAGEGGDGSGAVGSGTGTSSGGSGGADGGKAPEGGAGDGDKPLGPEGERALEREKERRRETSSKLKSYEELGMSAEDIAKLIEANDPKNPERIAKQAATQATNAANERMATVLRTSAIREVAATSGFTDPADALAMLPKDKVAALKVDLEEGTTDAAGVKALLEDLGKAKPYLLKPTDTTADHRTAGIGAGGSAIKADPKPGRDRLRSAYESGSTKK
jgi:hypothetical protein